MGTWKRTGTVWIQRHDRLQQGSYPEFWFEDSGCGIHLFFPHLFEWSEEMQNTIITYDVPYKKAIVLFEEITMLKEE